MKEQEALIATDDLKQGSHLVLEALAFDARRQDSISVIAGDLAAKALPAGFFADKLKTDLVVLSDTDFTHFVKNSTLVEPHVRIDDKTGTADAGGLFYTENLPPETLLVSLAMASDTRKEDRKLKAKEVIAEIGNALDNGRIWQFGGDATVGRGLVMLRMAD